ncbi:MAG: hypothetical protein RI907_2855 [Pseudomonadota bacterium]|jgi:two-component system sensor histidine kinase UhpB
MNWQWRRPGGITVRLLTLAVLPASLMFIMVTVAMYVGTINDVRRDVGERGRLIAMALAQSSPYGLVSGNLAYVQTTMRQLVEGDPSIVCIELVDAQSRPQTGYCPKRQVETHGTYEAQVHIESMGNTDLLDPYAPQASAQLRQLGTVRVTMSASPVFDKRRGAMLAGQLVALVVAAVTCLIAWRVTRRLRVTLAALLTALRGIRRGEFDVSLDINAPDELGEMQRTVLQMADALRTARDDLEHQVKTRTHELNIALDQIRESDAEKRRLITHSNAMIEADRKRVAVDIHDHLGASLISVRLEASALAAHADSSGHTDLARSARRIADTVQALYVSSRDIIKSLRPEVLDTLGLAGAVEELVTGLDKVHPDCRFHLLPLPQLPPICSELAMQAYRVLQESCTNIIKHAQATEAWVSLQVDKNSGRLTMQIRDNGCGFDTSTSTRQGLGLIGMRERVASVGGELFISSPKGQGTTVTVLLPLQERKATWTTPG